MGDLTLWVFLLALVLAVYVGVAREGRLAIGGYVLQTVLVAIAYGIIAARTGDTGIWWALAGLVAIRIVAIPALIYRLFPRDLIHYRSNHMLMNPTFALFLNLLLAASGIGVGVATLGGRLGLLYGIGLAVLLVSIAVVALNHYALKQIVGILSGDNAVDLIASLTLSRVAVIADFAVFVDVAIAVFLLTFLVMRQRHHGHGNASHMNELRG